MWNALVAAIKRFGISLDLPFRWTGYTVKQDLFVIERMCFTDKATIGELSIDGEFFCYTLEDTCRTVKIPKQTAIPPGRYELKITFSERFQKDMPLLLDVPNFEGVRIHSGNTPEDTDGCILVGMKRGVDVIYESRKAYDLLFQELKKRLELGNVYLSVIGGRHTA